ncbi:MAG TPA: malonic semialdehyde reductase [Brevundimonas sp.]|nr:malonic semialdehyde reductase [Brevundimonas sp.]
MAFDALSTRDVPVADAVLARLFTEARTHNGWSDRPVSEELIRKLYDLTKFGPTAVNMTPARFVFVTSPEAKARLSVHMAEGNRAKTLAAPVNLIIAQDIDFHDTLPKLFPHAPGARDWFLDEAGRREAAFRDAEAREREAEAEAKATAMVSEAIARGDVNAINYFVAQKYVEAFAELARSPQQKTVIVPSEMGALVGTIAGVGELVGLAKEQQQVRTEARQAAPRAAPRRSGGAVPTTE